MRARKATYGLAVIVNVIVALWWTYYLAETVLSGAFHFYAEGTAISSTMLLIVTIASTLAVVALWLRR